MPAAAFGCSSGSPRRHPALPLFLQLQICLLLSVLTCFLPPPPHPHPLHPAHPAAPHRPPGGCSMAERGGDYDLSRFLRRGWQSPASSSEDEGYGCGSGVYNPEERGDDDEE